MHNSDFNLILSTKNCNAIKDFANKLNSFANHPSVDSETTEHLNQSVSYMGRFKSRAYVVHASSIVVLVSILNTVATITPFNDEANELRDALIKNTKQYVPGYFF